MKELGDKLNAIEQQLVSQEEDYQPFNRSQAGIDYIKLRELLRQL
ncbi:hypothetical protein [Nostoc sp. LEGE 12450]|nr:hypothetical protein [Nostoc sp. LEGE 12450]